MRQEVYAGGWPVLNVAGFYGRVSGENGIVREIARDRRLPLVDPDRVLSGRQQYFTDMMHLTPDGYRRLADLIAPAVLALRGKP